ncbi:MAG: glycoside hydrolase family 18 protein [Patescibacteria group bacterium]
MKRFLLVGSFCVIITVGVGMWLLKMTYPQTPLQTSAKYFLEHLMKPHISLDKEVIGFLPYWQVDDISTIELQSLSEVNYFSLSPAANGELLRVVATQTNPGWREWDKQAMKDFITKTHILGTKFSLTILTHDAVIIESILSSKEAQATLINELIAQVKEHNLDGITIDFEYLGTPDESYQDAFVAFSKNLSDAFRKEAPDTTLSLSVMPRAARDPGLLKIKQLTPYYDRFIVMSYDYYGASSDIAGPVAPMKGYKEEVYFFDVTTTYADYLKVLPKEKIIMGVPYYGWDRAVEDGKTKKSLTFASDDPNNYTAIISYARMKESTNLTDCKWDTLAQERWCWYTNPETGTAHQVWIADEKSIGVRFDYAKKNELGGVAIWVLGYDKGYDELWNLLQQTFGK